MRPLRLLVMVRRYIRDTFEPLDRDGVVLWACVFFVGFAATYGV